MVVIRIQIEENGVGVTNLPVSVKKGLIQIKNESVDYILFGGMQIRKKLFGERFCKAL